MRLAILHYTHSPVIGGVERVIRDQAAALKEMGHEVDLLDHGLWQRADPSHFDAFIVHNVFTMPFNLEWTRELTALATAKPGLRWINWVHDVAATNPHYAHIDWQEPLPKTLHVAVSEFRRAEYSMASGLPMERIHVIPNGLDFASILGLTPRIAELRLWQHDLVLAHPTRLIRRKNLELGIRTTAKLKQSGCDVVYAITGAPDPHQTDGKMYLKELKELARELGVTEQLLWLGESAPLSDEDVRSLYVVADALFFPSTGEGFGLPLIESLAHRLPIFCSDLAVHREVLGKAGRYFGVDEKPDVISALIMHWLQTDTVVHHRRHLWREHGMIKICQEYLEPLLLTATATLQHDRLNPSLSRDPRRP
jgi:glycosyltransferase involved in cell wall biosynthesis